MPLLDLGSLESLNRQPPRICKHCGRAVRRNYCRQCDEFFEAGHLPIAHRGDDVGTDCIDHAKHDDHRTY